MTEPSVISREVEAGSSLEVQAKLSSRCETFWVSLRDPSTPLRSSQMTVNQ